MKNLLTVIILAIILYSCKKEAPPRIQNCYKFETTKYQSHKDNPPDTMFLVSKATYEQCDMTMDEARLKAESLTYTIIERNLDGTIRRQEKADVNYYISR